MLYLIVRIVLLAFPYFMLVFCNEKWKIDNVNILKRKPNKRFQPFLYSKNKNATVEIGLLIYEDFCYVNTLIILTEIILKIFYDVQYERFLLVLFFLAMLFLGLNNIIAEFLNKNAK